LRLSAHFCAPVALMMEVLNAICRLLSCAFDEKHILKWPFARVLE